MNWIRCQLASMEPARARASDVLPTPGTSSTSTWPSASMAMTASDTASGLPWITFSMLRSTLDATSAAQATSSGVTDEEEGKGGEVAVMVGIGPPTQVAEARDGAGSRPEAELLGGAGHPRRGAAPQGYSSNAVKVPLLPLVRPSYSQTC